MFFKIKDNDEGNLNKASFKIETDATKLASVQASKSVSYTVPGTEYAYPETTGKVTMAQPTLTYPNSTKDTLTAIAITEGAGLTVAVPTKVASPKTLQLEVSNTGLDGNYTGTDAVTIWAVTGANSTGATVSTGGLVSVANTCAAGEFTVKATTVAGTVTKTDTATVTITKADSTLTEVTLDKSAVTVDGKNSQTVNAKAYDQYGVQITSGVTWAFNDTVAATTAEIGASTGVVTVKAKAPAGNITVKATTGSGDSLKTATKSFTIARETSVPATVKVTHTGKGSYEDQLVIPADAATGADATVSSDAYTATVYDQYGDTMTGETIVWTLYDSFTGVSIIDGVVTITNAAKTYITSNSNTTVTATVQGTDPVVNDNAIVYIKRADPIATTVKIYKGATEITTSDTIAIPMASGANAAVVTYTAKLFDQYGTEMTGRTFNWTNNEAITTGTSVSNNAVTVNANTNPGEDNIGSFTLTATDSAVAGATKSITVNVSKLNASWDAVSAKTDLVYGVTNAGCFTGLGENKTLAYNTDGGETYGSTLTGTYSVGSPTAIPGTSVTSISVTFTASNDESNAPYKGVALTHDFTVNIAKATPTKDDLTFAIPTNHAYIGSAQGIGDVEAKSGVEGMGSITVWYEGKSPTEYTRSKIAPTNAGTYTVTAETGVGDNFEATITTTIITLGEYTIGKATITSLTGHTTSFTKLANAEYVDSIDNMKNHILAQSVNANFAGGIYTSRAVVWSCDKTEVTPKGGTYVFTPDVTEGGNFNPYTAKESEKVTLTVSPVNATLSLGTTSATKAMAEIDAAADYAAMGLPTTITVDYDAAAVTDTTYPITGWSMTEAAIKAIDATSGNVQKTLTPTFTAPDWATLGATPTFTLTITNKYPVNIVFTTTDGGDTTTSDPIGNITYGGTLATVYAKQTSISNGVDTTTGAGAPVIKFTYVGVSPTVYAESETAPKDAGTYKVKATLVSSTHSASVIEDTFTIAQKPVSITWTNSTPYTYNNEEHGPTATVPTAEIKGLEVGDTCDVVVHYEGNAYPAIGTGLGAEYVSSTTKPTNAGTYMAKVMADDLSNSNYKPDMNSFASFTIAKADRTFTVSPTTDMNLYGETGTITATVDEGKNLDNSFKATYSSNNTSVATVNSAGVVTAVGNGTATITVSAAETTNYNGAYKTVTVNAVTEPVSNATAASDPAGDPLTATVDNATMTIKVVGAITAGSKLTVSCDYFGSNTAANRAIEDVTADKLAAGDTIQINSPTGILIYTIDTSGVVLIAIPITEGAAAGAIAQDAEIDQDDVSAVEAALNATQTGGGGSEGLAASAAQTVVEKAPDVLAQAQQTTPEATRVEAEVGLKVEAVKYSSAANPKVLELKITPQVTYKFENDNGDSVGTPVTEPLTNAELANTPVKVKIALPAGFVASASTASLFAKHTKADGTVEYLPVTLSQPGGTGPIFAEWTQTSFSTVELLVDSREGRINYFFEDGSQRQITYTAADLNKPLPTDSKSGNSFNGWTITLPTGSATPQYDEANQLSEVPEALTEVVLTAISGRATEDHPAKAVAKFTPMGGAIGGTTSYTITASAGEGGKIAPEGKVSVEKGKDQSFAITADKGYKLSDVLVDGKSVGAVATYAFEKVDADHSITAKFEKTGDVFKDVKVTDWFYDDVYAAYNAGLMEGDGDLFNPYGNASRAMAVTVLWRMAGSPDVTGDMPFTDVPAGEWYTKAVLWAYQNKIVDGMTDTTFEPLTNITREQMACILYRYATFSGLAAEKDATGDLSKFPDGAKVSDWALDAMRWCVAQGMFEGRSDTGELDPGGLAQRCEMAALMNRFAAKLK